MKTSLSSRSSLRTILDFAFERVVGFVVVELELVVEVELASSAGPVAAVDQY